MNETQMGNRIATHRGNDFWSGRTCQLEYSLGAKQVTKPTKITWYRDNGLAWDNGVQKIVDEFKKQTGVELVITDPAHNQYQEKVKLAFASGDVPDVIDVNGADYVNYAMNGALWDMTAAVKRSKIFAKFNQKYLNAEKINGRLYGMPAAVATAPVTYMRKDLLDKFGLEVPTTYKEFYNVLKVFAKNGYIAYTAPGLISSDPTNTVNYVREFYQNAVPDFIQKNGKWVDGMAQPEMKQALKRLKDAYAEGLIDKEIITNKTSTCRDKWISGKVGVFTYWPGSWFATLGDQVKKAVPGAETIAIPAIKETKYIAGTAYVNAITSKAQNPEGIFKYFIEYIHNGEKGTLLWSHGVEGVHYQKNADGSYSPLPTILDPKVLCSKFIIEVGCNMESNYRDPIVPDKTVTESMDVMKKGYATSGLKPPSESYNRNNADLLTLKSKIIAQIVVGDLSVDQGLADYKNQAKSLVDPILSEFNARNSR